MVILIISIFFFIRFFEQFYLILVYFGVFLYLLDRSIIVKRQEMRSSCLQVIFGKVRVLFGNYRVGREDFVDFKVVGFLFLCQVGQEGGREVGGRDVIVGEWEGFWLLFLLVVFVGVLEMFLVICKFFRNRVCYRGLGGDSFKVVFLRFIFKELLLECLVLQLGF